MTAPASTLDAAMTLAADTVARVSRDAAVLLVCHVNPDGDALGSMLGFGLGLRQLGPRHAAALDAEARGLCVEGDGVHEIAVGPVHAGLIEPGHFRFSVAGETVLRLKARLWFVHRGLEKLFQGRQADGAVELPDALMPYGAPARIVPPPATQS